MVISCKNGCYYYLGKMGWRKPDSTFETPGMNSFNHYSYGAIGDWMYRVMVGLDTYEDGVGYKHIKIKPHIGGGFSFASASLQTYYGELSCGWKVEADKINMDVEIPANTTATLFVPAANADAITESGKPLSTVGGIKVSGIEDGYVMLNVGSGDYHFSAIKPADTNEAINLNQYVGKYKVESGMIKMVEIKVQGGKLIAVVFDNSGEIEPVKNIKDQFTSRDGSTVNFIRDETGNVVEIIMNALGMTFEGKKQ